MHYPSTGTVRETGRPFFSVQTSDRRHLRCRKRITCSFPEKNGRFGHSFREFIEQVIFFQALTALPVYTVLDEVPNAWIGKGGPA